MMSPLTGFRPSPGRTAGSGALDAGSSIMTTTTTGTHPGAGTA